MNKYFKKIPIEIIGLIVIGLVFYVAITKDRNNINMHSSIDTCIAIPFTPDRVDFYFNVNDFKYRVVEERKLDIVEGEKYLIRYDTTDPTNNQVLLNKPIFIKSELVDTVLGIVREKHDKSCIFKYSVNKKGYKKKGYYNKKIIESINVDSIYRVVYWLKNPKRAILLTEN